MTSTNEKTHPQFKRTGKQAYRGFEQTAVLPEDPELTHTDPGTPMGTLMRRRNQFVCPRN